MRPSCSGLCEKMPTVAVVKKILKKIKILLEKPWTIYYNIIRGGQLVTKQQHIGVSPNGKALDSDSSISRFES